MKRHDFRGRAPQAQSLNTVHPNHSPRMVTVYHHEKRVAIQKTTWIDLALLLKVLATKTTREIK